MPRENKANQATKLYRVSAITDLLLAGLQRRHILQYVTNADWGISEAMVDKYIREANDEIAKTFEPDTAKVRQRITARYEYLYRKMIGSDDFKGAAMVMDKLGEITGAKVIALDANVNIHDEGARDLESFSDEELEAIIASRVSKSTFAKPAKKPAKKRATKTTTKQK